MEKDNKDSQPISKKRFFRQFPAQFWLVVMFEFFERGSYYGMMSFISVYFTDILHIPKENVGIIKGVIQPLLYFLPIISGAIADRFGYRKVLMVAFTLLGTGYFLTSQATEYTAVFAAMVVMGFGAGTFKPIISGTIARVTDKTNSTQGFGIFYWSINMGAFLFPFILVPFLKNLNPSYVIIASAICTATMLIPTALFFKDPRKLEKLKAREKLSLIHTLANAFEIIYSPLVLLFRQFKKSSLKKYIIGLVILILLGYSFINYLDRPPALEKFSKIGIVKNNSTLIFKVNRNMFDKSKYQLKIEKKQNQEIFLDILKPDQLKDYSSDLLKELHKYPDFQTLSLEDIEEYIKLSEKKVELIFSLVTSLESIFRIEKITENQYEIAIQNIEKFNDHLDELLQEIQKIPILKGITAADCHRLYEKFNSRSFFLLFIISVILIGLFIIAVSEKRLKAKETITSTKFGFNYLAVLLLILVIWLIPGIAMLGRIVSSIIYLSVMSLFIIDKSDTHKFTDHAKFLLMIFLYSGFWILYFQMFDSVLWYVQAYVDTTSLNSAVNNFLHQFGIKINWFFDVEHVTVINAGTIIILQLLISNIVKKKKALPTMITGIGIGTCGMAILAISTNIWIFILGITIFSIGEMTAHPKFISYVGLIAPDDKKGMYQGYLLLYGVFGASIGGIVGARLYVHFVDHLNQPRTLWLVFTSIGIITIIGLLLYNRFLAPKHKV